MEPMSLGTLPIEVARRASIAWLPYEFARGVPLDRKRGLLAARLAAGEGVLELHEEGGSFLALRALPWDSRFFGFGHARIDAAGFDSRENGERVLSRVERALSSAGVRYFFAQVPVSDLMALDVLGNAGWSVVENRLTYWMEDLSAFQPTRRYAVRSAVPGDIPELEDVAASAVNVYDRFHADPLLEPRASELLRIWVRRSVADGFADGVLIPATGPKAFMTYLHLKQEWETSGTSISQLVLSAVHPSAPGWHPRLVSEGLVHLRDAGAVSAVMTTQASNRGVVRSCEHVGFRLAVSSLIMRKIIPS